MEHTANQVTLRGSLAGLPEYSHENHGRRFFRFLLEVPRLSGTVDILPVIAEDRILDSLDPSGGEMLTVSGSLRSHNLTEENRRRLLIFVFADSVTAEDGDPINEVILEGTVCREPSYRRTPLGREICDIMLAVPRAFRRADYLPCIAWGSLAHRCGSLEVGDTVCLSGRLQSRIYTKQVEEGVEERVAFEVSVMSMEEEE